MKMTATAVASGGTLALIDAALQRLRTQLINQGVLQEISAETIRELETRKWQYILGARLRSVTEIREEVL